MQSDNSGETEELIELGLVPEAEVNRCLWEVVMEERPEAGSC